MTTWSMSMSLSQTTTLIGLHPQCSFQILRETRSQSRSMTRTMISSISNWKLSPSFRFWLAKLSSWRKSKLLKNSKNESSSSINGYSYSSKRQNFLRLNEWRPLGKDALMRLIEEIFNREPLRIRESKLRRRWCLDRLPRSSSTSSKEILLRWWLMKDC